MGRSSPRKDRGELCPSVGGGHVHDSHCLDARLWRIDSEEARGLATLDTAPELPFGGDDQVLVERIRVGCYFNPLAAPCDHREDRTPGRDDPHVMLELRHIFLCRSFLREVPGQHEFGLEHGPAALHPSIEGGPHPAEYRVADVALDVGEDLTGVGLVPTPVECFGDEAKLNDGVAGEVFWFDFTAFFSPKLGHRFLVITHDDAGSGATDEVTTVR